MDLMNDLMATVLNATTLDESAIQYLKATALAQYVLNTPWVWPACETFHFLGLALLMGAIGPLDFRLLGFMKQVPISAFRALVPWAVAGFLINLATGLVFLIAAPDQYMRNVSWWMKVFFLFIAGANILWFELSHKAHAEALPPGVETPSALKVIGGVSIVSWFMVLFWGRMLAFLGNAF